MPEHGGTRQWLHKTSLSQASPRPPPIPGLPNARPAFKASALWAWGGSAGGVAFQPPRPKLNVSQAQGGAAAATLLVRWLPWRAW
ncbi:unnamed protein product [Effrenium voratum]|uniref:Uncharacterized protein n=1 Tax=Effrenium voratum TaxID=2562239 RepID=A0AA36MZQ6_9DINO|nr:unnamed protein product [Effrenium voratum]